MALGGWRWSHLKGVVKGEPVEEDVGEELAEAEDAVDHPVGQPLGVVLFTRTLNGFDPAGAGTRTQLRRRAAFCRVRAKQPLHSRVVGRVDEADQVAEQRGAVAVNQVEPSQRHAPWTGNTTGKHKGKSRPLLEAHRLEPEVASGLSGFEAISDGG